MVPVRYRLRDKGVRVSMSCELCTGDIEHLLHLFVDCKFAKECWQYTGMTHDISTVENAQEWFLQVFSTEKDEYLINLATVMWGIWWTRNKKVWEGKVISPSMAMDWSRKQVSEWREANKKKNKCLYNVQEKGEQHVKNWKAPEEGTIKLNVNASVFNNADFFLIGMVIRDSRGSFLHGKTLKFPGSVSVLEAELVGILAALQWCAEFGDQVCYIESDSLLGVQAIKGRNQNNFEEGFLIEQCRMLIDSSSNRLVLGFAKKQANKVAHLLARLPCALNSFVYYSSPPHSVLGTLVSDACF